MISPKFPAEWVHCSPLLITKVPDGCSVLPRRVCQCPIHGSHDHLVDQRWGQHEGVITATPLLEVRFPPPDKPWSINEVPSNVKAKIAQSHRKQAWRDATMMLTKSEARHMAKPFPPSTVQVTIPFRTAQRRDPHNYTSTVVKAIVDGLRLAGLWPDDNADWVTVLDPRLVKGGDVVIEINEREVA